MRCTIICIRTPIPSRSTSCCLPAECSSSRWLDHKGVPVNQRCAFRRPVSQARQASRAGRYAGRQHTCVGVGGDEVHEPLGGQVVHLPQQPLIPHACRPAVTAGPVSAPASVAPPAATEAYHQYTGRPARACPGGSPAQAPPLPPPSSQPTRGHLLAVREHGGHCIMQVHPMHLVVGRQPQRRPHPRLQRLGVCVVAAAGGLCRTTNWPARVRCGRRSADLRSWDCSPIRNPILPPAAPPQRGALRHPSHCSCLSTASTAPPAQHCQHSPASPFSSRCRSCIRVCSRWQLLTLV